MAARRLAAKPSSAFPTTAASSSSPYQPYRRRLLALFCAWKLFLFVIAAASPGSGYDSSTDILFRPTHVPPSAASSLMSPLQHLLTRLSRWDAIYFTTSASRSHVYEQEWAFSWLLAKAMAATSAVLLFPFDLSLVLKAALSGVLLANVSHLLSVIVLYHLAYQLLPNRRVAFTTAALHIFSPAGLFLSAPYAESSFALFNFLGFLLYARSSQDASLAGHVWLALSGLSFGLACTMRGNGLLSGVIFAWDVVSELPSIREHLLNGDKLRRMCATVIAGTLVAMGFALPQTVAFFHFCTNGQSRPWCTRNPPSIYTFVQSHYWNVGFLKYWTLSNLPLFLLALPMCWVMAMTAKQSILSPKGVSRALVMASQKNSDERRGALLRRFALPQLILVALALTSFHVQIINRISSGYPVWYFLLAVQICGTAEDEASTNVLGVPLRTEWLVRSMILYALVQGGLYASFLPPA